jgi:hypothetical protein
MRSFGRRGRPLSSPFERQIADHLDAAREGEQKAGRPLRINSGPFPIDAAAYLRAAAGPPAWSRRLARLETLRAALDERLQRELDEFRERLSDVKQREAAWRAHLATLNLDELNQLIDKHNAFYAIEARLRMQWPSGRYILPEGVEYPLAKITVASLLERFPATAA